jgi:hypothetical protein
MISSSKQLQKKISPIFNLHKISSVTIITLLVVPFLESKALAVLFLTGSVSSSIANAGFQTYESRYGSGSLGFDLGRYIRLQYTYSQEYASSYGYKDQNAGSSGQKQTATDNDCSQCTESRSMTRVIGNSLDLQIVLYEGTVLVPYITLGSIIKTYEMRLVENGVETGHDPVTMGPLPNLGLGVGLRLNKDFTLKISYITSPSVAQERGEEPRSTWDKKVTVGLTYQI